MQNLRRSGTLINRTNRTEMTFEIKIQNMPLFSDYHANIPNHKWHLIEENPALKAIYKGTPLIS